MKFKDRDGGREHSHHGPGYANYQQERMPILEGKVSLCLFPTHHDVVDPCESALESNSQCRMVLLCLDGGRAQLRTHNHWVWADDSDQSREESHAQRQIVTARMASSFGTDVLVVDVMRKWCVCASELLHAQLFDTPEEAKSLR